MSLFSAFSLSLLLAVRLFFSNFGPQFFLPHVFFFYKSALLPRSLVATSPSPATTRASIPTSCCSTGTPEEVTVAASTCCENARPTRSGPELGLSPASPTEGLATEGPARSALFAPRARCAHAS